MSSLGSFLAREGFAVIDAPVNGRESEWRGVSWLFVHHTASTCDPDNAGADARYIKTASGRFPPLSQLMLGQDNRVYVTGRQRTGQAEPGRASHAGEGVYPGIPRDQGNAVALGLEVQCSGRHPLATHAITYTTMVRLLASLCRRYTLDPSRVIGHKEYSTTGKIDPLDNMTTIRRDVAAALKPQPHPPAGDTMMFLSVKAPKEGTPVPAGKWVAVKWTREADDDWKGHPDGYARIDLPRGGLVSGAGMLRWSGPGPIEARFVRGPKDGTANLEVGATLGLPGPFTIPLAPVTSQDSLWLEVQATESGTLTFAQLRIGVTPRT